MQVNLKTLAAISRYASSNEETRYYLRGVYVHSDAEYVYMVATDGHRMIVHRLSNVDAVDWSFIVPQAELKRLKFGARDTGFGDLLFDGTHITVDMASNVTKFRPVDGVFPDYVRARPADDVDVAPAHFNGSYMADFDAFAKAIGCKRAVVTPRGGSPALVTFEGDTDTYGALMPIRDNFATRAPF